MAAQLGNVSPIIIIIIITTQAFIDPKIKEHKKKTATRLSVKYRKVLVFIPS